MTTTTTRSEAAKKGVATRKAAKAAKVAEFRNAVYRVIEAHQAPHFMDGGKGVCCYVWVNGQCFSGGSLRNAGDETFREALKTVPGYMHHHVNID